MLKCFALGLLLSLVVVEAVQAQIYVPGQLRNGIYIRPHFVAAPQPAAEASISLRALPEPTDKLPPKPPALPTEPAAGRSADKPAT